MNKSLVVDHLSEAIEELTRTVAKMRTDPDYNEVAFEIALTHAYNHLNTAWNARRVDVARCAAMAHEDFVRWRQFPADIDLTA